MAVYCLFVVPVALCGNVLEFLNRPGRCCKPVIAYWPCISEGKERTDKKMKE